VSLSWTASAGATSYSVRRSTTSGSGYTVLVNGLTTTSHTDTTVINGTTYYYVVTASKSSPAAESGYSAEVSATPVNSTTALQTWRQANFGTTANEGDAANTADPDADGQSNLLEYALGTNPNTAGALPVTVARSGNALTLSFSRIADATLVYKIEASNDLVGWTTAHTYGTFPDAGTTTYTDTVQITAQPRRFLRLVVTAP
jgi:fibronectin type 3 domain-containing protein